MKIPDWMRRLGKVTGEQDDAIFVDVPVSKLEPTIDRIKERGIVAVNGITVYDSGKEMEVLYHFIHRGVVLSLRFRIDRGKPSIQSIDGKFPSAMLFEQENHEMFGIEFIGNRSLKPLLLDRKSPRVPLKKNQEKEEKK
jgi:NADH:ubiquinone oxidoreductase subunit C